MNDYVSIMRRYDRRQSIKQGFRIAFWTVVAISVAVLVWPI